MKFWTFYENSKALSFDFFFKWKREENNVYTNLKIYVIQKSSHQEIIIESEKKHYTYVSKY